MSKGKGALSMGLQS